MNKQKGAGMEIHTCTHKQTDYPDRLAKGQPVEYNVIRVSRNAIGMEETVFLVRVTVLSHRGLPALFVCLDTLYTIIRQLARGICVF